ncbi:MAG: hypothetical protein WB999_18770, partial [Candidatus Binataceae bacterium]
MKSILTGPKVHRSNRHIFTNAPNVIEGQTIDPTCIAIAMSTGEIALVGESKADRKTIAARFSHHLARITHGNNNPPTEAHPRLLAGCPSSTIPKETPRALLNERGQFPA